MQTKKEKALLFKKERGSSPFDYKTPTRLQIVAIRREKGKYMKMLASLKPNAHIIFGRKLSSMPNPSLFFFKLIYFRLKTKGGYLKSTRKCEKGGGSGN